MLTVVTLASDTVQETDVNRGCRLVGLELPYQTDQYICKYKHACIKHRKHTLDNYFFLHWHII